MIELVAFSQTINNINARPSSELILYFAYYLEQYKRQAYFVASDIKACFDELHIKPYSNISAFLSSKSGQKNPPILKQKVGYYLAKHERERIELECSDISFIPVTDAFFNSSMFTSAPYYIKHLAGQIAQCYDSRLYDAASVLIRKLLETLIIECFERFKIEHEIKDSSGHFMYLSDLVPKYLAAKEWNVSRNAKTNIMKVKRYGDLCAHNRRFIAKKVELDDMKFELRQVIEEIVLTIDYAKWNQ